MDYITLHTINVQALIGILPEEQTAKQRLGITVTLGLSLESAGLSDEITDTVNYAEIEDMVMQLAEVSHFNLIERFAAVVAGRSLDQPLVQSVKVVVAKPDILNHTDNVSVTITRSRV